MLSHLRFHRRGPSNPSSPQLDQLSPFDHAEHPQTVQDISSRPDFLPRPSTASNTPPVHPSSARSEPEAAPNREASEQSLKDTTFPPLRSPSNDAESSFMGSVGLDNYRRAFESPRAEATGPAVQGSSAKRNSRNKPLPPPINTNLSPQTRPSPLSAKEAKPATSFMSPTELQNNVGATGNRPAAIRLASEPPALTSSNTPTETHKGRKSFLKNPMSGLLMRRKASQNAPDLRPLPLPQKPAESTYDPRIKGTRVHDFSAPRQRMVPTRKPTVPGAEVWSGFDKYHGSTQSDSSDLPLRTRTGKSSSAASENTQVAPSDAELYRRLELSKESSKHSAQESKRISLDDKPLPAEPQPSPAKDVTESNRSLSTRSRPIPPSDASPVKRANPSTRTNRSRHISLSDGSIKDGAVSALPRHMKSTSSRFSFDMIGAARAEKLLEERHRQKELERNANGPVPRNRDSRFDDFDVDTFDYDAAMDDGGLEEIIPGVNADCEEDDYFEEEIPMVGDDMIDEDDQDNEDDPDNDQENFAGFVFQRSNTQSSLTSPSPASTGGLVATPRDPSGKPIGFAMTNDTALDSQSATAPLATEILLETEGTVPAAGLGIQGLVIPPKTQYDPTVFQERRNMPIADDHSCYTVTSDRELYFDEGLREELAMEADEIQKSAFDESLFDLDDTDEYGRPLPGVFAQAQAMRAALDQEPKKRESDMTSHSGISGSTAHTSVSMGLQPMPSMTEKGLNSELSKENVAPVTSPSQLTSKDKMTAYQEALVEATHKAAESGWKFRWEEEDSPEPPPTQADPDVTVTSPTTGSQSSCGDGQDNDPAFNDYDDDGFDDDFAFDDDFIAEANAEALAYDSDGFYGQEFGFYSAPVSQTHHGPTSNGMPLNETFYGGYFGPSGVSRSTSNGRMVSREPNLTPITERSEYSNRNSIMSLALPGAPLGTSEGRNSLQSPGLAQLAMMADDGHMNLETLLRLRTKAWGGSQVSLSSSREGSPRSERALPGERFEGAASPAPWEIGRPHTHLGVGGGGTHARKNSAYSLLTNSDAASGTGSPTFTMGMSLPNPVPPQPLFSPPPPPISQPSPGPLQCPPVIEDEAEEASSPARTVRSPTSPTDHAQANRDALNANSQFGAIVTTTPPMPDALFDKPNAPPNTTVSSPSHNTPTKRPAKGHGYKGSAESVSYVRDEDTESGEMRWVVERRREAESGEIEILERKVVTGGSI